MSARQKTLHCLWTMPDGVPSIGYFWTW